MFIHVDPDQLNQKDAKYFVVFEGSRRRHVVSACRPSPSEQYLITYIPGKKLLFPVIVSYLLLIAPCHAYQGAIPLQQFQGPHRII